MWRTFSAVWLATVLLSANSSFTDDQIIILGVPPPGDSNVVPPGSLISPKEAAKIFDPSNATSANSVKPDREKHPGDDSESANTRLLGIKGNIQ